MEELLKGLPVKEIQLMVEKPSLGDPCEVKRDARHFRRIVSVVEQTRAVIFF